MSYLIIAAVFFALGTLVAGRRTIFARLLAPKGPSLVEEYERLGAEYKEASLLPKLCRMADRPVPPDQDERCRRALRAYADFMRGLDERGIVEIVMHLDRKMREHGGDAPIDHLCEFFHEELDAIRKDERAVDPHRYRFGLHFIPSDHPALYVPYRPRSSRA